MDAAGLAADKSLGQHFLFDPALLRRIVDAAEPLAGARALEIGPGPGGLTAALLQSDAAEVIAIERDARMKAALAPLIAGADGRLEVIEADALEAPWRGRSGPFVVVANLPYNISTPLLFALLDDLERMRAMVLMFQKEVADRLLARPGERAYGRLGVAAQWRCAIKKVAQLPPGAFSPPPKVASTVLRFDPRPEPLSPAPAKALDRVLRAAFQGRRKMLRRSLAAITPTPLALLERADIAPERRGDTLTIAEYCALARALDEKV